MCVYICLVAEAAGQGGPLPGRRQEVQGAVRAVPPRYQQLQLQIYGGEECGNISTSPIASVLYPAPDGSGFFRLSGSFRFLL